MSMQHKQPEKGRFLRSGEVASASGVNFQTLRYYERRGLLATPQRNGSGHRLYPPHTVTLLRMIKSAQRLGLSLDEIASVIASDDAAASIAALAKRRVVEIDAQIVELRATRDVLASYID
ncbi:MAG TPA: MerR family transcriptional regulator [Candidatus Dormibacteraeota bacterium]|jgi:DNA-binding transcriptional MerR regulator|nr:MerR family transcriptional regulator [Candidatus Dormibacteraeota bacterium]